MARRALLVLTCALLVPIVPFVVMGELPGERFLLEREQDALAFGAVGALLLMGDVLLPIPSSVLATLLGARLGLPLGFTCAFLGLSLGHLVGYGLGRLLPSRFSTQLPHEPSLWLLFASRPVPVLAEAVVLAAGALRVPFLPCLASLCAGNALYAFVMAANGAAWLPDGFVGTGLVLPLVLPVAAYLLWRRTSRHVS